MLEPVRPEPPAEERPRPDIRSLRDLLQGPFGIRSVALTGLFILAAFYTLCLARGFFLPIVLALLFAFLLSPVVRGLKRIHIPVAVGAAIVVLGLLGALGFGFYELTGPAYEWAQQAPRSLRRVEQKLQELKKPVQTVKRATAQVEQIAQVGGGGQAPAAVTVQTETLGARVFSS